MPGSVGIRFTHASLQELADQSGIDLLHIKGPAVDDSLLQRGLSGASPTLGEFAGPMPRHSVDADVLVRPDHVDLLFEVMHRHGWTTAYRFEDGSAFEHAATLVHPFLAPVDVHRRFPGIDRHPDASFERLWASRRTIAIAGKPCVVPSVPAQRLILIVHAARGGAESHPDIDRCWTQATDEQRQEVQALAAELGGEVALAAGTGRLNNYVGAHDYDLWRILSTGEGSLSRIWLARVKAAPTNRAALRTAVRLLVPNRHRLQTALGRAPTSRELTRAYTGRAVMGARELWRLVRLARTRLRGPR